jgi:hypothetical protein
MAKNTGRALSEGCYMILSPSGDATPESSEIRALRKAVAISGAVVFVKWGQSVDEAVTAAKDEPEAEPKPRATRKKAEPKADLPPEVKAAVLAAVSPVDGSSPDDF